MADAPGRVRTSASPAFLAQNADGGGEPVRVDAVGRNHCYGHGVGQPHAGRRIDDMRVSGPRCCSAAPEVETAAFESSRTAPPASILQPRRPAEDR